VQAFYDWYLTDTDYNHLLARPELAPEYVEWLEAFSWEYNPIVCAQDLPVSAVTDAEGLDGSSASVSLTLTFNGFPGRPAGVDLTLGPEGWLIDAIYCED
jgi:hypothetical protein